MKCAHHMYTHKNQTQVVHVTACSTAPKATKRQNPSSLLLLAVILPWLQEEMQKHLEPTQQGGQQEINQMCSG